MALHPNSSDRTVATPTYQYSYLEPSENTELTGLTGNAESKESLEGQSLFGTDDKKSRPKKLGRGGKILECLIDGVGMMLCIGIIVFSILVRRANGNEVGQYEGNLVEVAGIGVTAFPYIFSLFIGRNVQSLLKWHLGCGVRVLQFAYMSKSLSLATAVMAPLLLRAAHWVPFILIPIWILSPLGSRTLKQFFVVEQEEIPSNTSIQYFYPRTTLLTSKT